MGCPVGWPVGWPEGCDVGCPEGCPVGEGQFGATARTLISVPFAVTKSKFMQLS